MNPWIWVRHCGCHTGSWVMVVVVEVAVVVVLQQQEEAAQRQQQVVVVLLLLRGPSMCLLCRCQAWMSCGQAATLTSNR